MINFIRNFMARFRIFNFLTASVSSTKCRSSEQLWLADIEKNLRHSRLHQSKPWIWRFTKSTQKKVRTTSRPHREIMSTWVLKFHSSSSLRHKIWENHKYFMIQRRWVFIFLVLDSSSQLEILLALKTFAMQLYNDNIENKISNWMWPMNVS